MSNHWYLIAQRAEAKIYEQRGVAASLRLVERIGNPKGVLKTSELVSDRQGRSDQASRVGHNAVGEDSAPRENVLKSFTRRLSKYLEAAAERGDFDSLVLVAEPHVLGELKKSLGRSAERKLRQTLSKDLLHVPETEVSAQLSPVLCHKEAIRA